MGIIRLAILFGLFLGARENFVLSNPHALLKEKSVLFIQTLSSELKEKTGFSLYVVALNQTQIPNDKQSRDWLKQEFLNKLSQPYGVLFFFQDHQKIDLVMNPQLPLIDKAEIISNYMVPILIQDRKLTPSNISAAILNGYAQFADEIASHYQVVLENNLIVDRSGVKDYIHYLIYMLLGVMFSLVGMIYLTRKR